MFERFTDAARHVIVAAQEDARRLGHNYIGCEHLLLAAAATGEPSGAALREHGVTRERVEAEMMRMIGRAQTADPLSGLDRQALASIGIDLDVVSARIEAAFGPDALSRAAPACRGRRSPGRKRPLAGLARRRRRRARGPARQSAGLCGNAPLQPGAAPRGHIPFTPRAKKSLALSLRESQALHDDFIGAEHLTLALLAMRDGMVPVILAALDVSAESLRAATLARYRKAS
ncbi:MAG TPA: Clp protease N-terminal domain-containing protein [Streptosporangiaceae bacterium]|nr:Clp protease N-terminal domain-containing protein [Streptosporangiaceae bacterium]